jgi:hypothetical protein
MKVAPPAGGKRYHDQANMSGQSLDGVGTAMFNTGTFQM